MDFAKIKEKIESEWEKMLLAFSIAFAVVALSLFLVNLFVSREEGMPLSNTAPNPKSYLNRNAFAFLYDPPALEQKSNPFQFTRVLAKREPKPQTPAQTASPEQKPAPPKPPEFKAISFSGQITSSSGQTLAFLSVADSKTKKTVSHTVAAGDTADGFKIDDVDAEAVSFTDGAGRKHKVQIHSSTRIVTE